MSQTGGPQGYGYGYGYQRPEHPDSQTVLILGIVGIFVPVVSFIAWYMGNSAKKQIQAGAPFPWSGNLKVGYLLGMIFGILEIVGIALVVLYFLGVAALFAYFAASIP